MNKSTLNGQLQHSVQIEFGALGGHVTGGARNARVLGQEQRVDDVDAVAGHSVQVAHQRRTGQQVDVFRPFT